MTNEEAIVKLEVHSSTNGSGQCTSEEHQKAKILAIKALEKQIPKKPILDTIFPSGIKWWRCPACRHNNIEKNDRFCHNCGQKLDWSKNI